MREGTHVLGWLLSILCGHQQNEMCAGKGPTSWSHAVRTPQQQSVSRMTDYACLVYGLRGAKIKASLLPQCSPVDDAQGVLDLQ